MIFSQVQDFNWLQASLFLTSSFLLPTTSFLNTRLVRVSTFATPSAQGQGSPRALLGTFPTWKEISREQSREVRAHIDTHTHTPPQFFSCPLGYSCANKQTKHTVTYRHIVSHSPLGNWAERQSSRRR